MDEAQVEAAAKSSATTTRSSSIAVNLGYLTTPNGMMKLLEFIFGLICWATLASYIFYSNWGQFQFVMFVAVTAWITTFLHALIFFLTINANYLEGAPWEVIEFGFDLFWAVMYFIAACVESSVGGLANGAVKASITFCWFTTILYIIHTVLAIRSWKGVWFWQLCATSTDGDGSTVNT